MQREAQAEVGHQRAAEGPSKASGFQRLLLVLEGEPFKELLTQPGGRQPSEFSQVSPIFLMRFTCSSGKWLPRKSQRGDLCGQNPGHAAPKGPGSGPPPRPWQFPWHPELYLAHLGKALAHPARGHGGCCPGFMALRDIPCLVLCCSLGSSPKRGPAPRATLSRCSRSLEREVPAACRCGLSRQLTVASASADRP